MALRDAQPLRDEPSTLERFLTFLGRPGYVVNSLLSGEAGDALENTAMFGEELLTGSWLHGKRLTSLLPGGDPIDGLTSRKERPEFTDMLRRNGLAAGIDRGSWGELGFNVLGGALTDPFSYIGGIGLGAKVGRVGKGALSGLGAANEVGAAARSSLARALNATEAGAEALAAAGSPERFMADVLNAVDAQPAVRLRLAEEAKRVRNNPALMEEALVPYATAPGPFQRMPDDGLLHQVDELGVATKGAGGNFRGPLTEAQLDDAAEALAAKRIGLLNGRDGPITLTGTTAQDDLLTDGIRALEGRGLIRPAGVPTLEIPGVTWTALPGGAETWSKIGLATPLHVVKSLIGLPLPGLAEAMGKHGAEAVEGLTKMFYDRRGFGIVPDGLKAAATMMGTRIMTRNEDDLARIPGLFREVGQAGSDAMGKVWLRADDLFRKGVTKEQAEDAARRLGFTSATDPSVLDDVLPWLGKGDAADYMRVVYLQTRKEAIEAATQAGAKPDAAARALDAYVDDMRRMPDELVEAGQWTKAEATPFYLPHQASDAFALFLASGTAGKKLNGKTYQAALRDVFMKAREHPSVAETLGQFKKIADEYGVTVPDVTDFKTNYDAAAAEGGLFNVSLDALWLRRRWAHNATVEKAAFEKLAKSTMNDLRHGTILDDFLAATLTGVGARGSTLGKILGGGKFRFGGSLAESAARYQSTLGGQPAAAEGARGWLYEWPGLSSFFKPALYLPSPSTFVRNGVSGAVMGLMDPDVGFGGALGLLSSMRDLPAVKALVGAAGRDEVAALMADARGLASPDQLKLLASVKVGGHNGRELAQYARGAMGSSVLSDRASYDALSDVQRHLSEVEQQVGGWAQFSQDAKAVWTGKGLDSRMARNLERYRSFWKPLGRLNGAIEDGLRVGAFYDLIKKGYDPASALEKVRLTFVDYAYQSDPERALRDLLPFVRFTLGAGPNAIKGSTGLVGRAVGRGAVGSDDGKPLPTELRGQVSLPLGGNDYATSLGLPFEAGAALLGLVPGAQGFYRNVEQNVLGAAQPVLKTAAEAAVGKQFYSDLPLSEVKQFGPMPPFASHALFGFLPLSRFRSELTKYVGALHGDWRSAVNLFSGVKIRTVDAEREAERVITRWLEKAVEEGDVESMQRFFVPKNADPNDPRTLEVRQALERLATMEAARRKRSR